MKKRDSLYRLDAMHLNVPEILQYLPVSPTPEDRFNLDHILHTIQRSHGRLSVRTEKPNEFKSPFLPNALIPEVRKFLQEIDGKGYETLITKGTPTDCIIRGNCVPGTDTNYFEYLAGKGTVRDIDQSGRTPKTVRLVWGTNPGDIGTNIAAALQLVNSRLWPKRFEFSQEIVEFSVYSKPVGILGDRVIFWEVRPYAGSGRR